MSNGQPPDPVTAKGHHGTITVDSHGNVTLTKTLRGATRIPAANIQAVEIVPAGIGMRAIRLVVAGGTLTRPSTAFGNHADLAQDPYALTFRRKHLPAFQLVADRIEHAVHAAAFGQRP